MFLQPLIGRPGRLDKTMIKAFFVSAAIAEGPWQVNSGESPALED
jgi:hypothetical protein